METIVLVASFAVAALYLLLIALSFMEVFGKKGKKQFGYDKKGTGKVYEAGPEENEVTHPQKEEER